MKRFFAALAAFAILLTLPVYAALPKPTEQFFCADFANVLSPETEDYIVKTSAEIMKKYNGTQIVVATINSLDGKSIEEYSVELAREWKIGKKDEDNGLLILLSVGDRKIRVEIGYGLEGVINDAKAGRYIRDVAKPYLKDNNWDKGITELYKALAGELENPTPNEESSEESDEGGHFSFIGALIMLFIIFNIVMAFNRRGPRGPRGGPFIGGFGGGFGGGGFGGGFGGGSGFSGGGDSGGFSGGGGSFGGGGASGDF